MSVWETVAHMEYSPLEKATPVGRYQTLVDAEGYADGERWLGKEDVTFSPLLIATIGPVTVDDFPENFTFGAGAFGQVLVKLKGPDGFRRPLLTWYVFPYGTVLTADQQKQLQAIAEGDPPGAQERHVWVKEMIDTPLPVAVLEAIPSTPKHRPKNGVEV